MKYMIFCEKSNMAMKNTNLSFEINKTHLDKDTWFKDSETSKITYLRISIIQFFISPFYRCPNCRIKGYVQKQQIL